MPMVEYTLDTLPELTEERRKELARLDALPADQIDTSDIPQLTDEQWAGAVRGRFYRPIKQQVTARLDADVLAWLKAGGQGYQTRMNAILRRADGAARAPERRFGDLCISASSRTVTLDGKPVTLTPREWAILDRLSHRPGQVVGKAELEDAVYGFGEEVESNAIEAHVSRLRAKLGRAAVETVRGFGYRFRPTP